MVYHGPSKGCRACRKRRVKCDQGKPACNNCIRRGVECPGYESTFDYRHRNETASTIQRAQQKGEPSRRRYASNPLDSESGSEPGDAPRSKLTPTTSMAVEFVHQARVSSTDMFDSPGPLEGLDPDPEPIILSWYFKNYPMKCIDPQSQHGFVSLLKPIYLASSEDSPVRPAVAAVASNLLMLFCHQGSDTDLARKFYSKSITRMNKMIADPVKSKGNDLLITALALNFYETLNTRWSPGHDMADNHRQGALALLKHRGPVNFENDVSKYVTASLRAAVCYWAFETGTSISPDILKWLTEDSLPVNKAAEMDMITMRLIEYQSRFRELYDSEQGERSLFELREGDDPTLDPALLEEMIDQGLDISDAYKAWEASCPTHWKPLYVPADELPSSIIHAGVHGQRCSVYWDLSVCDTLNNSRVRQLRLLRIVRQLCTDAHDSKYTETLEVIDSAMQKMVDEICESLPFMIGDVVDPLELAQMYDVKYPTAFNGVCTYPNIAHDHPRAAGSSGGWYASALFVSLAKLAVKDGKLDSFPLRAGQFDWIVSQLGRMQRVFLLSQPKMRPTWTAGSPKKC